MSWDQIVQIAGATMLLVGFILSQTNRLSAGSYGYLLLNLLGGAILFVLALQGQRWGFVLLEGVWMLVALVGLILRLSGRDSAAAK